MVSGDDSPAQKKRRIPWQKSYSKMSQEDVEKRIGISMQNLASTAIAPRDMVARSGHSPDEDTTKVIKDEVYKRIMEYLDVEVSLVDRSQFMEANVNDLVLFIITPVIYEFKYRTGRKGIKLFRKKKITSEDSKTGGYEEFVVADTVSLTERKYILIIEAKRVSIHAEMGQCLLAMKDMGDSNHGGVVYGFITTGDSWRMLSYDGGSFQVTDQFQVVFETMGTDKDRWIRECSVLVDCVYGALSNGGIVKKDVCVVSV